MNLHQVYIDFHCGYCGEVLSRFVKGQFNAAAYCQNPNCKKVVSFEKWILVVSFLEATLEVPTVFDGIELECPSCKFPIKDDIVIDNCSSKITCARCLRENETFEFIQFFKKF
jgi:hypothetical protein